MRKLILLLCAAMLLTLGGCAGQPKEEPLLHISAEEAKALMDKEQDYVILDVRTAEEFAEGHIPGAVLLPDYEVAQEAESVLPDKAQLILVYCRSGRRSALAAQTLADLGYTRIREFGGIIDWPYEIVTE